MERPENLFFLNPLDIIICTNIHCLEIFKILAENMAHSLPLLPLISRLLSEIAAYIVISELNFECDC